MSRNLTLFASILVATFAVYAADQPPKGAPLAKVEAVREPATTTWIPPSFDIETTPPEAERGNAMVF